MQNKPEKPAAPVPPAAPTPAARESDAVDPGEIKEALEDPHIAEVVDVFKGKIVDIQEEFETTD